MKTITLREVSNRVIENMDYEKVCEPFTDKDHIRYGNNILLGCLDYMRYVIQSEIDELNEYYIVDDTGERVNEVLLSIMIDLSSIAYEEEE